MESSRILIVASDPSEREALMRGVSDAGYEPVPVADVETAVLHHVGAAQALVLDSAAFRALDDENVTGITTDLPCIVAGRDIGVAEVVEMVRRGAFSVVTLPLDVPQLHVQIEQALRHRDLSRRNADLQRSLDVHERLAMIGKLAAGVAHELNNPLDGVLRFVNLSVDSLASDAPQLPYLHEARRGLRRMADIVRDLLQFSRNAVVEIADEDAERLARDAVGQVVAADPAKVVETAFDFPVSGLPLPRAMFQVIGNLAKNAVDAMPHGGKLRVAAELHDGRMLIRVNDSGAGIPDEIRERVFEPFFTTKEVGKGTGLGLSICQRIVERLGGSMSIESEIGHGTVVLVDLPVRRRLPAPSSAVHLEGTHVARPASAGRSSRE